MKYNYIDLFAGCGGLSEGFEKSQLFEGLAFVEWEKFPCQTLKKRLVEKWKYKNTLRLNQHDIFLKKKLNKLRKDNPGWDNKVLNLSYIKKEQKLYSYLGNCFSINELLTFIDYNEESYYIYRWIMFW